jgi:poly-beta-hydroxybutyrate-responsive repressor
LLLLLHQGLSHGYALLEQLGEYGLGHVDPSAVYRALREMETEGWVTSTWDEEKTQGPPRRVYQISEQGDEALAQWIQVLEETQQNIDRVLEGYGEHMREHQDSENEVL